jgi:hypothetical protein
MTLMEEIRIAMRDNIKPARQSYMIFIDYCEGRSPGRVPGCDTIIRLAHRSWHGRGVESNAAREYLYRWSLALRSPIFGVPHTLGL